jgi:hypothetical protein
MIIAGMADTMAVATIRVMTAEVMQGAVILVMAVGDNAPSMGCPPIVAILAMEAIAGFAAIKV